MKKTIIIIGTLVALVAVVMGALAVYVYRLDFGVDYKGRARLDYNWKYYFAECPKEEYKYRDKIFSFSYPKFKEISPINAIVDSHSGLIPYGNEYLEIIWHIDEPAPVKSELLAYLSTDTKNTFSAPSDAFIGWLLYESDKEYSDFGKIYSADVRKVFLKDGSAVIVISLWSKIEPRPHRRFVVGIAPGGQVFKMRNMVRLNPTEKRYRELMATNTQTCTRCPNPARDANSACTFSKFLETLEFVK